MTSITFDLISDLHIDERPLPEWSDQVTSPFCVVAGDVARDRAKLQSTLTHLGECYQQVLYVDGNEEHKLFMDDLDASYDHLSDIVTRIPNVLYLRDDIVVVNGVAFVAANGWWTYDFESSHNIEATLQWFCEYTSVNRHQALKVIEHAHSDTLYLINSIKKVQLHPDIHTVIMITHSLPDFWLVSHDISLSGTERMNCVGNNLLSQVLSYDLQNKIKTWCVGHYHLSLDREMNGIHYVSNVRGRFGTNWFSRTYQPKRIHITD